MTEFIKKVLVVNQVAPGGGGTVTVNQGEPNPDCAQAWPVRITAPNGDGGTACIDIGDMDTSSARVNIVAGLPAPIDMVDFSGTITLGGTSQLAIPTNLNRKYIFIQNVSTGDIWFNFNLAATLSQPSIRLSTGDSFVMESSAIFLYEIYIIGATTGQPFVIKSF
jgi:hypothetical protein